MPSTNSWKSKWKFSSSGDYLTLIGGRSQNSFGEIQAYPSRVSHLSTISKHWPFQERQETCFKRTCRNVNKVDLALLRLLHLVTVRQRVGFEVVAVSRIWKRLRWNFWSWTSLRQRRRRVCGSVDWNKNFVTNFFWKKIFMSFLLENVVGRIFFEDRQVIVYDINKYTIKMV